MTTTSKRQVRRLGRIPLITVAAATALVVAGCANSSSDTSGGTAAAGSPGVSSAADAQAVTDYVSYTGGTKGKADSSQTPVTLGWVNQQGGALGFSSATDGAQAAVDYVNNDLGGIGGHPLKLATCYIAANEQEGNACGLQLVNDKSVKAVLFGTVIVGDQAFQAVNKGQKPVLMGNSISPVDAGSKNVYIYNGNPSSIFGGLATYASSVVKAKTVSVIYPQDAQSTAGVGILKQALTAVGIQMKAVGFDPSTTNLTGAAVAAGVQSADLVIPLVSTPPACIAAAKALDSLSVKAPIISTGSFCFTAATAQGLGGQTPTWQQLSTQTNVADQSLADVKAYLNASSAAGLSAQSQTTSDATLAWGLVLTAARLLNAAGGANATEATVAAAAEKFTGPMLLGSSQIKCGGTTGQPGLCGAETRVFQHTGGSAFKALTDWLQPSGI